MFDDTEVIKRFGVIRRKFLSHSEIDGAFIGFSLARKVLILSSELEKEVLSEKAKLEIKECVLEVELAIIKERIYKLDKE